MSRALAHMLRANGRSTPRSWPPDEERAVEKTKSEARVAGATLEMKGRGGLLPSLVLGIFRRDDWRCKRCGKRERLGVHHKGNLENPASAWLRKKGKRNDFNNLVTICATCHDAIHEEDRGG